MREGVVSVCRAFSSSLLSDGEAEGRSCTCIRIAVSRGVGYSVVCVRARTRVFFFVFLSTRANVLDFPTRLEKFPLARAASSRPPARRRPPPFASEGRQDDPTALWAVLMPSFY